MNTLPPVAEMERAYLNRDASFDGLFFLGVRSTGIYCRPSCPARKPLPENVAYFATAEEARRAGFRPCKRCHPMGTNGQAPDWIRPLMQRLDADPTVRLRDHDLRTLGLDPARVRRYFLQHHQMTFHAWSRGHRMGQALTRLRNGANLDAVVLDHGYDSHSGFREAFGKTFGQPPGRAVNIGCVHTTLIETPLGPVMAGASAKGVCLVEYTTRKALETQLRTLRRWFDGPLVPGMNLHLEHLRAELDAYFAGVLHAFTVPLQYPGTPFQQQVWGQLQQIPYGETWSYEALAQAIGNPGAVRAVGTANGQNRIAILIPCHRVVNKDGRLGGYGGGLWRKQALLDLERRSVRKPNTQLSLLELLEAGT
jgi:AraC family transcriptional regulator of adaptative response/methylated-DNA-[protein]-cysteine methyltransferase